MNVEGLSFAYVGLAGSRCALFADENFFKSQSGIHLVVTLCKHGRIDPAMNRTKTVTIQRELNDLGGSVVVSKEALKSFFFLKTSEKRAREGGEESKDTKRQDVRT